MKKIRFTTIAMSIVLVLAQLMFIVIPVSANDPAPVTESTAPLFVNDFQFFVPEGTNHWSDGWSLSGSHSAYHTADNVYYLNTVDTYITWNAPTIFTDTTAYVAYKLKNDGSDTVSIGTVLYFKTTEKNLCACVRTPLVYDLQGNKLSYKTSVDYTVKTVIASATATVEIPAGAEVYIAIPFVSAKTTNGREVPGIALAAHDTFATNTIGTDGCLYSNNTERSTLMQNLITSQGKSGLSQIQFIIAGNGADNNGARTYTGDYNLSVSGVYAVTKEEYNAKYNAANFKMVEGAAARLNVKTGMRFAANISNDYYDYLVNTYGEENVSYGTIITPKHYADAAGAMTFAALDSLDTATWGATKYLNVEATAFRKQTATLSQIAGSLVEIKEDHYDWNYSAVSYVKIVKGNEVIYLYAANAQTGMISDIAQKAVNDRSVEEAEGYGNNLNDGHANGNWSPYNTDEIDILKGFYS